MIRINLLPPEIIERRKWERFYPYVFMATGILLVVVLVSWGAVQLVLAARNDELQRTRESAAQLQTDAEKLAVFELQEQELAKRQDAVTQALRGRFEMGRIAEEISLVLPEEVWAEQLTISEENGLSALFHAPNPLGNAITDGYKSVASTLVRLSTLEILTDVWLSSATVGQFGGFQGIAAEVADVPDVSFELTAKLKIDPADAPVPLAAP